MCIRDRLANHVHRIEQMPTIVDNTALCGAQVCVVLNEKEFEQCFLEFGGELKFRPSKQPGSSDAWRATHLHLKVSSAFVDTCSHLAKKGFFSVKASRSPTPLDVMLCIFHPSKELNARIDDHTAFITDQGKTKYVGMYAPYKFSLAEMRSMLVVRFTHFNMLKVRVEEWENDLQCARLYGMFFEVTKFGLLESEARNIIEHETAQLIDQTSLAFLDLEDVEKLKTLLQTVESFQWSLEQGSDDDNKWSKRAKMVGKQLKDCLLYTSPSPRDRG